MDSQKAAKFALLIAQEAQQSAKEIGIIAENPNSGIISIDRKDIFDALSKVTPALGNSYAQVKRDIQDINRISWAGDAHEIREILTNLLRTLAPDKEVESQFWFKSETKDGKPTQRQRVRYILQSRGVNSTKREVVEKVDILDEMIGELVRSTYSRASDAAHTYETRKEVVRLLGYFEAFAHDLLDLG